MNTDRAWIALLDEDEDDFLFWRHGFQRWAGEVDLKWFRSAEAFLLATATGPKPMAVVLDGVVPTGEEEAWLSKFLVNDCCLNTPVFMLAEQFNEADQQAYQALGATGYLCKPINRDELQRIVIKLIGYQSTASGSPK
ncbi:response regulator [Spirosoma jeollabukense]